MRIPNGFSLIELLLVLTLLGILTSFALPAWQKTLTRARRTDAITALSRLASLQEQFRLTHRRYADSDELAAPLPAGLGLSGSAQNHYALATSTTTVGFTASATVRAAGRQAPDERCWVFRLDAQGRRTAYSRAGVDTTSVCWKT